jgi:hypothetical protein
MKRAGGFDYNPPTAAGRFVTRKFNNREMVRRERDFFRKKTNSSMAQFPILNSQPKRTELQAASARLRIENRELSH